MLAASIYKTDEQQGCSCCFPGASAIKDLPATQETWVRSLSWEDPLEEGMTTHSSVLAWKSLWTEEPDRLQSTGSQRVEHNSAIKHRTV